MNVRSQLALFIFLFSVSLSHGQSQIGSDVNGERAGDNSGIRTVISGDGNTIVIGAPKNYGSSVAGTSPGHVRVYKKNNGVWVQKGADIDGSGNECFGATVSISRNAEVIAVGAPCVGSGLVRVYKFVSGKWTQIGSDIKGEALSDAFGCSISLSDSGKIIAIGAYANDGNSGFSGDERGHVRVYANQNNAWSQMGSEIDGEAGGDFSGTAVSLSGNGSILAVGSPRNAGSGKGAGQVRVFQYSSNQWIQKGKWLYGEAIADYFGWTLSLNSKGDVIAVGGPYNDASGSVSAGDYGHVRVFGFQDTIWAQIGVDIDGESKGDKSGWSLALNEAGDVVIVGAPENDGSGVDAGSTRIYKLESGVWTQIKTDIDGESKGDYSGYSVSVSSSGSTFAIGAPYNDGSGADAGHVRVYVSCNINYSVDSIVACQSLKWTNGKTYTTNNNTATDTFINVEGCDSIVKLNLTINQHSKSTVEQKSCDEFMSPSKKRWRSSGIFKDTIRNSCGCDSVMTYSLTITHTDSLIQSHPKDQTVSINDDAQFVAKSYYPGANYRWQSDIGFGFVNLSNASQYQNVQDDTLQVSSVTQSNNLQLFRCVVSRNACLDTSDTAVLRVSNNSGNETFSKTNFSISPNPCMGELALNIPVELIGKSLFIFDSNGKVVYSDVMQNLNTVIPLGKLGNGIYLVNLGNCNQTFVLSR